LYPPHSRDGVLKGCFALSGKAELDVRQEVPTWQWTTVQHVLEIMLAFKIVDLDLPNIVFSLPTPGHIVAQKRGKYVFLLGTKRSLFAKVLSVPFIFDMIHESSFL